MADNEATETKEKRTVPALVRTARGVADHAAATLEMHYDREKRVFKDPIMPIVALYAYAKITAALLDEAQAENKARMTAAEVRVEKLEQQVATFEEWRAAIEKQTAEAAEKFEEMMNGGDPIAKLKEMVDAHNAPTIAPPVLDAPVVEAEVVQLNTDKKDERGRKKPAVEKNGGAA